MKFFFTIITIITVSIILAFTLFKVENNKANNISAYYNVNGSFAGFVQMKKGLIRACEFSTNGTVLSCSKWFDEELLKQGQNPGLSLQDI